MVWSCHEGSQRSWGFGHIRLLQRFGVVFGAPGGMSRVWGLEGGFLGGSFTGGLVPGGPGVRGKYVGRVGRSFRVCGLKKAKRHPVLVPIFRVARRNCRTTLRKPAESGNKSFACVCVKCPIGGAGEGGRGGGPQAEGGALQRRRASRSTIIPQFLSPNSSASVSFPVPFHSPLSPLRPHLSTCSSCPRSPSHHTLTPAHFTTSQSFLCVPPLRYVGREVARSPQVGA